MKTTRTLYYIRDSIKGATKQSITPIIDPQSDYRVKVVLLYSISICISFILYSKGYGYGKDDDKLADYLNKTFGLFVFNIVYTLVILLGFTLSFVKMDTDLFDGIIFAIVYSYCIINNVLLIVYNLPTLISNFLFCSVILIFMMSHSINLNQRLLNACSVIYLLSQILSSQIVNSTYQTSPDCLFYTQIFTVIFFLMYLNKRSSSTLLAGDPNSKKDQILNFEDIVYNMHCKYICFQGLHAIYTNKSYKDMIDRYENAVEEMRKDRLTENNRFIEDDKSNRLLHSLPNSIGKAIPLGERNAEFLQSMFKHSTSSGGQVISLYETLLDIINYNTHDSSDFFLKLGIHKNENDFANFFDVYYRKSENSLEVILYEVTEIKESEKISAEYRYKQKIFSKIAHEFKTPLNNMISITNTISDINKEVKSAIKEHIAPANDSKCYAELQEKCIQNMISSDNLAKIIGSLANMTIFQVNDLINYSQNFDFGLIKVECEEIKIKEIMIFSYGILEALIYCFGDRANKVKPSLIISKEVEKMIIKSDDQKIKQILINLITNAVKFTKVGKITLSADHEMSAGSNSNRKHVVIRVLDTGIGISEEEKAQIDNKLKEKYSNQLDDDDYMNSKGTGLGLFICKAICNRLNFQFEIEKVSVGTSIAVHLLDGPMESCKLFLTNKNNQSKKDTCGIVPYRRSRTSLPSSAKYTSIFDKLKSSNIEIKNEFASPEIIIRRVKQVNKTLIENLADPKTKLLFLVNRKKSKKSSSYVDKNDDLTLETAKPSAIKSYSSINTDNKQLSEQSQIKDRKFGRFSNRISNFILEGNESSSNDSMRKKDDSEVTVEYDGLDLSGFLRLRSNFLYFRPYKIVVVDDSIQIMKSTSNLLRKVVSTNFFKFEIVQGRDGIDTLKYVIDDADSLVRIVFTDEHMEYMNGSESARLIKRYFKEKKIQNDIHFVSITCFTDESNTTNIRNSGIDYVINKPATEQKILEVLNCIIVRL